MRIVSIAFLAMAIASSGAVEDVDTNPRASESRLRGLQGTGSVATQGLKELHVCVPWESVDEYRKTHSSTDLACATNSCAGGCCRHYHWLMCDTSNRFPAIPCICNDLTMDPAIFTKTPTAQVSIPNYSNGYAGYPIGAPPGSFPGTAPGSAPANKPANGGGGGGGGGNKNNKNNGKMK